LSTNARLTADAAPSEHDPTLREVVERLAPLERRAGSDGEREAAEWIRGRLADAGCEARVEEERFKDGYAPALAALSALGAASGAAALTRRGRLAGAIGGALAAALIADDISNGPRVLRRAVGSEKTTWNVIAEAGDASAERTLVVMAHHDAAPTGLIFDDSAQAAAGKAFPGVIERIDTSLPLWWPVAGSPALIAIGAARRNARLVTAGVVGCVGSAVAFADIARSPVVPGANDNLSAVAALVALAEAARRRPIPGLRLLLVSCGAEEVLQGGVYGVVRNQLKRLDRERTWVLNLDTVGSPELIMVEGEGAIVMEDYFDRSFRDLVAAAAERAGLPLRRGMRARTSTDAVVTSRAGYPTANLTSWNRYKALSNYHKPSDTPENLRYSTVAHAVAISEAVARALAHEAAAPGSERPAEMAGRSREE